MRVALTQDATEDPSITTFDAPPKNASTARNPAVESGTSRGIDAAAAQLTLAAHHRRSTGVRPFDLIPSLNGVERFRC